MEEGASAWGPLRPVTQLYTRFIFISVLINTQHDASETGLHIKQNQNQYRYGNINKGNGTATDRG